MVKKIINGILTLAAVGIIAFFGYKAGTSTPAPHSVEEREAGGVYEATSGNFPAVNVTGLVKSNGITNFQKVLTVAVGTNYTSWKNDTRSTVFLTEGIVTTSGTASSSVNIFLIATTSPATLAPLEHFQFPTVLQRNRFLSAILVSTSTAATTTSNFIEMAYPNSGRTNGIVAVPAGARILLWIQNAGGVGNIPDGACNGVRCEAATSTNLGIGPVTAVIRGYSTTTQEFTPSQY